jgi:hypothetical protein
MRLIWLILATSLTASLSFAENVPLYMDNGAPLGNTLDAAGKRALHVTISDTVPTSPGAAAPGTVKQAAITVGTSAVRVTTDGAAPSSTRVLLAVQPLQTSTANFYLGSSSVTSSGATRGIQIFPGQILTFSNDAAEYYIISDTAGQTVLIMEQE